MKTAALSTEQTALLALCISPLSVRDAATAGQLNALANLTRKGLAAFAGGAYVITARGSKAVSK